MTGIPLALGSYWAMFILVPGTLVLVFRILDEEKLLTQEPRIPATGALPVGALRVVAVE